MGHAAYMRGSRTISAQACKDTGCWGCIRCKPDGPKPTARPPGWGDKARQRAEECARSMVAGAGRYGLPRPTVEALTLAVADAAHVAETTASAAAMAALADPTHPTAAQPPAPRAWSPRVESRCGVDPDPLRRSRLHRRGDVP